MTKDTAYHLVKQYVDGWKENNAAKIIKPLLPNCEIVESHGPTYKGIDKIKKWVEMWIESGGKVNQWDIVSFYFVDDVANFEWIFDCSVNNKTYHIEGISTAHFEDNKISYLREYRMTKPSFEWNEKEITD